MQSIASANREASHAAPARLSVLDRLASLVSPSVVQRLSPERTEAEDIPDVGADAEEAPKPMPGFLIGFHAVNSLVLAGLAYNDFMQGKNGLGVFAAFVAVLGATCAVSGILSHRKSSDQGGAEAN